MRHAPAATLVFYDGVCGLCDRFVQFILARDRHGSVRFAQLQGDLARRELVPRGHDPADLDSIFVIAGWDSPRPTLLTRSGAVLHVLSQLGSGWAVLTSIGRLVPQSISDAVYRFVARRRYRLFGKFEVCPLPRPEWRSRFLD